MLRAVLVDDEIPVLQLLKMFLEKSGEVKIVQCYSDPYEALEQIQKLNPDVIFLDIEMPEMNGIQLASQLTKQNDEWMIVFITGYNQYALEAFEVNARNYILKPVTENKIKECIVRLNKYYTCQGNRQSQEASNKVICFGGFEVYGKNGLIKWPTRKAEELLAYFIVNRDCRIEGETLGETLWPNGEPKKVKMNLHTALYRLRKIIMEEDLPIEISSERGGIGIYHCSLSQTSCDLIAFEAAMNKELVVNKHTLAELEKVIKLYKDDLFGNKGYDWAENKKELLQRWYLQLLINVANYYMETCDYSKAENELLKAEMKEPFNEQIHQLLLKNYAYSKNKAALIKCHEQYKGRLRTEMRVEPEIGTIELYRNLMKE